MTNFADYTELEEKAHTTMAADIWSYVSHGAGDEFTQSNNVAAFRKLAVLPRMLRASAHRDLSVELCGISLPTPLFMAPVGVIGLCDPHGHGEIATAQAAARTGVPMVASTMAVDPLETVAAQFGDTPGMFQLYTPTDRDLAQSLVQRAEAAGFRALVVTLDCWHTGWRPRDTSLATSPRLRSECLANYLTDPVFQKLLPKSPEEDPSAAMDTWNSIFGNRLTWDDLPWLRSLTRLPLVLKGICHPDDVRRAKDAGVDAIYCSNHGGRQTNGGLAAIDALPGVVAAADGMPVLFDSGIRSGADVVKALALGATAVGIGRPYIYGLSLAGADGIVNVLDALLQETDLLMGLDGYPAIADLTPEALLPTGR
ncbi:alpha-hydroxy-acid oxidizing protein [Nocardia altamirensis]|uniref:alpha-hydroxy-acid oxidizing protein n=1 Tax=Nocardia altamirensis TaxID=472158 RepID=UPI0009FE7FA3|nr:alpha-hydroxy-acid oxidizing protein [Nocardia altamirensis]